MDTKEERLAAALLVRKQLGYTNERDTISFLDPSLAHGRLCET